MSVPFVCCTPRACLHDQTKQQLKWIWASQKYPKISMLRRCCTMSVQFVCCTARLSLWPALLDDLFPLHWDLYINHHNSNIQRTQKYSAVIYYLSPWSAQQPNGGNSSEFSTSCGRSWMTCLAHHKMRIQRQIQRQNGKTESKLCKIKSISNYLPCPS